MSKQDIRQETARLLAEDLLQFGSADLVGALAESCTRLDDQDLRLGLLKALQQVDDRPGLDAIWSIWQTSRHPDLEALLVGKEIPASRPPLLGILSALKLGEPEQLSDSGPEVVPLLLTAAEDPDPDIRAGTSAALQILSRPESQDEVCRWVIEHDHPLARLAALEADFAPQDPLRRALFYLLTEQWGRYEALDFDASLLRAVHQAADSDLRQKIASLARRSGWAGYTEALTGQSAARRLSDLEDSEWQVILALLGRHQRWEEAWQLAQAAPPLWSARLLHDLSETGWSPAETSQSQGFQSLAQAALTCLALGEPLERLPQAPRLLEGHSRPVTALAFSPQGDVLASGGADRGVLLWNPATGELVNWLEGHSSHIASLAFSPQGDILASGGADRSVRLWGTAGGDLLHTLGGHGGEITALAFHPHLDILASGDPLTVRLWDAANGSLLHMLPVEEEWGQVSLAFSPDGSLLASNHKDSALHLWRLPDGEPLKVLMDKVARWAFSPRFTPAGGLLATSSSYGKVRLWRTPGGDLQEPLEGRADGGHLVISPNGRLLAASDRLAIRVWELPGGQTLTTLTNHTKPVTALAFGPHSRLLASAGGDRGLCLWDLPAGKLLQTLDGFTAPIQHLDFSPDGAYLACADREKLHLWPLENLGVLFLTPPGKVSIQQVNRAGELLHDESLAPVERTWISFTLELHRWRGRFDIGIERAPQHLTVGDFDIEISG